MNCVKRDILYSVFSIILIIVLAFFMSQDYSLEKTSGKGGLYLLNFIKNVPDLSFSYEIGQIVARGSNPFISYIDYGREQHELDLANHFNIFSLDISSVIILYLFVFTTLTLAYLFALSRQRAQQGDIANLLDKNIVPIVIYSILFAIAYFFIIFLLSKLLFKPENMYFLWLSTSIDIFLYVCSFIFLKNTLYFVGGKLLSIFKRNKEYSDITVIVTGFAPYLVLFMLMLLLGLPRIVIYFITTTLVSTGLFGDIYYSISKRREHVFTSSS